MSRESPEISLMDTRATMHRARGYQTEMYERSMKGNVIVAMDTGSGKTQIAVLRIMAELDRCPLEKLIWFLAPTVALCTQQHDFIRSQLPAARMRLLIGSDNVDRWSEPRIWDAALDSIQIVVSTHAVLADALGHGFVKMRNLALLVFDEAHHCSGKHPANRIMKDFYHPLKLAEGAASVPHILGLSASPIRKSKISDLRTVESNLDSISVTPRLHREEMFEYVQRPTPHQLEYTPIDENESVVTSDALRCLQSICRTVLFEQECGALELDTSTKNWQSLETSRAKSSDSWEDQLWKFYNKARHIYKEVGPWGADYFITESIAMLRRSTEDGKNVLDGWRGDTRTNLLRVLSQDALVKQHDHIFDHENLLVSPKVQRLISFLGEVDPVGCSGLIFVRQRATVSVLCKLLSVHDQTKGRFQCATFVGLSNSASRKYSMAELFDLKAQRDTMTEFRARRKNLIIATDVLEEGIDVTACNLVVCFDPPQNLKSFIQRRGRARKEKSDFAIMFPQGDALFQIESWNYLEDELIREYQSEVRQLQNVISLEDIEEEMKEKITVPATGATLTPDSTIAHLHHFCALLPHQPYVDLRPAFSYAHHPVTKLITATVVLPNCVNSSVRSAKGRGEWRTERAAKKDAAFYAYLALYQAGLLNDNLLPLTHESALAENQLEELPALVETSAQYDPWKQLAEAWSSPDVHKIQISVQEHGNPENDLSINLIAPSIIPSIPSFLLYWNESLTFSLRLSSPCKTAIIGQDELHDLREITDTLLRSTLSEISPETMKDFIILFSPDFSDMQATTWLQENRGKRAALETFRSCVNVPRGFIRSALKYNTPYMFRQWQISATEQEDAILEVECARLPKRRNFLTPSTPSTNSMLSNGTPKGTKLEVFPVEDCTIDLLPFDIARFSLFIPAIMQHIEVLSIAHELCGTILKDVRIKDVRHVITAICAPSAEWTTDYQRYEFFGDTILKFTVSWQLFCDHVNWPEGYLSQRRDRHISNTNLARAALDTGLDAFIITELTKGKKWAAPLISSASTPTQGTRNIRSKVLADVVEALIGAAFFDGGIDLARICIHTFLPPIRIDAPRFGPQNSEQNAYQSLAEAEAVIGYQFNNKILLLEALNSPSQERDIFTESYQRLEFLGDAVLDYLLITLFAKHKPESSQGQMSQAKAALANADILSFFCLDFSHGRRVQRIEEGPADVFREKVGVEQIQLWKFMRHHSQEIAMAQETCLERYRELNEEIRNHLNTGNSYPWVQLARLNAPKFYSDIIESILGAIFVDSNGNLDDCHRFVERIGLGPYARRIIVDGINVIHPKNVLERLSGSDSVQYSVTCEDGDMTTYQCVVSIDDVKIVEVKACLTRDEAVVVAADAACKLLRGSMK